MHPDHEKQGTAGISAERSPGGEMDGQRILAQMHAHCTQYRLLVKDTLHKLKEQEYAAAKSETVRAQQSIEQAQLAELQRMAEDAERPLTALEKTRLVHLQSMDDKQRKEAPPPEVLDKTFGQLLDQTASSSNYQGLLVEDELEGLTTPFVQELMTKVEELYRVNQSLLQLASRCRGEALKDKAAASNMKLRIQQLEQQAANDESEIAGLREAIKERDEGLDAMRSAYHKEVIQVKEELVKNMTHKGAMIEDMEEVISRGFDLNLLAEPLGKDAEGRDLEAMVQGMVAEYDKRGKWELQGDAGERKVEGSLPSKLHPDGNRSPLKGGETLSRTTSPRPVVGGGDGGGSTAKIMILENERVQLNIKVAVMRHGLETWRKRANSMKHLIGDEKD